MRGRKKGHPVSEETRKKISVAFKGKKLSDKHKESIRKSLIGREIKWKDKISKANTGKVGHVAWNKDKKGLHLSPKSEFKKGMIPWNKGTEYKQIQGEKHHSWQGGTSFLPYTVDWTESLRISIRERDRYICGICGEKQGDKTHAVHHIDYNKKNCDPKNLVTLCPSCHAKTNYKRDYWIKYFNLR